MSTARIAKHALEVLKKDDLWDWPDAKRIQAPGEHSARSHFERIAPKFLHHLIKESLSSGDGVLKQFWKQLGACDEKLEENSSVETLRSIVQAHVLIVETLKAVDFVSSKESFDELFRGLDPNDVNFKPVLDMAVEYFTHLGVVFMNPGGPKPGTGSASSVSEFVSEETETLLQELNRDGEFGARSQRILKELSFRRDGQACLLTRAGYTPFDEDGISPDLARIIPNSVHHKVATLRCISTFAGKDASKTITRQSNDLGNAMNMQTDAHQTYNHLRWGIEAREADGVVRYFFRSTHTEPRMKGPGFIALRDGDEIQFGAGREGRHLEKPNPALCNLRLAVARVMGMSTAADIVLKWKEEAGDDGWDDSFIASEESCGVMDAKLFLSGRAVVV